MAAFSTDSPTAATGVVGHYTQVVWADVTKVGCGFVGRINEDMPAYKYEQVRNIVAYYQMSCF